MAEKQPERNFSHQLFCPKCDKIPVRVFDLFINENSIKDDENIKLETLPLPYVILGWIACANPKCKNWFLEDGKGLSRCPVCKKWSALHQMENMDDKIWECQDETCGWRFSIIQKDDDAPE